MRTTSTERPTPIVWAVILTAANAVGGVIFTVAMPDLEDRGTIVPVSIVAGALLLAVAWFLWSGARWAAIATVALNLINVLMAIPAYFADDGAFMLGATVSIILSVLTIALVLSPAARAFWGGTQRTVAT